MNSSNLATSNEGSNSISLSSDNHEQNYQNVHKEKPYKCDVCKNEYYTSSFFELHFKEGVCSFGKKLNIKKENMEDIQENIPETVYIKEEIIEESLDIEKGNISDTLDITKEITTPVDETGRSNPSPEYVTWSNIETKCLIVLYEKYKAKVGTIEMKNMKKLWETIATEMNKQNIKVTSANCENKWRVLERGYRKYLANKNRTGRCRKFFEYAEDMDRLFQKKRNIHPEILLSSDTIIDTQTSTLENNDTEIPESNNIYTVKNQQKNNFLNRNKIVAKMRQDRQEYYKERLKIEQKKLELKEKQVEALIKRNILIEQRNEILKLHK